jgi:hypothetical protein
MHYKNAKTAQRRLIQKLAFAVTDKGHAFDADAAALEREYHEARAALLGRHGAEETLGGTIATPAAIGKQFRFGNPYASKERARHLAYVEAKHLGAPSPLRPEKKTAAGGGMAKVNSLRRKNPKKNQAWRVFWRTRRRCP